jgi:hypothetical protein
MKILEEAAVVSTVKLRFIRHSAFKPKERRIFSHENSLGGGGCLTCTAENYPPTSVQITLTVQQLRYKNSSARSSSERIV